MALRAKFHCNTKKDRELGSGYQAISPSLQIPMMKRDYAHRLVSRKRSYVVHHFGLVPSEIAIILISHLSLCSG